MLPRALDDASRFLIVSRFSRCSRGGARGRARDAASGFGFNGEDMAGAWSSSNVRLTGRDAPGVFAREFDCDSAMAGRRSDNGQRRACEVSWYQQCNCGWLSLRNNGCKTVAWCCGLFIRRAQRRLRVNSSLGASAARDAMQTRDAKLRRTAPTEPR